MISPLRQMLLGAGAALAAVFSGMQAGAAPLKPGSGWLRPDGHWALKMPVCVLLAGDSLMESLGPQMRDALSGYKNLTFITAGKKSTGLSRSDYYDWPRVMEEHLRKERPNLVVMWVGTNDPQGIYGKTGLGEPGSKEWQKAYLGKIYEIFALAHRYKARLILMGPPTVADSKLDEQLAMINRLMDWACKAWEKKYHSGVCYVDTRAILGSASGQYISVGALPNGSVARLRTSDGVHITADGNKRVMHYLLPHISQELRRCFDTQGRAVYGGRPRGAVLSGRGK